MNKIAKKFSSGFASATLLSQEAVERLRKVSSLSNQEIYEYLESSPEGLTDEFIDEKLDNFGANDIRQEKKLRWYVELGAAFLNPFVGILAVIAIVSFILEVWMAPPGEEDYKTVIVVGVMVMVSSLMRFIQEYRSSLAAEKLKSMVKTTATVFRSPDGKAEIDIELLVPGDIVYLSAGDMIPADCRVLQSKDLFLNQSVLTGEAMPVEKKSQVNKKNIPVLELENICFMGSNVESGTATAIVVNTGSNTYFGGISKSLTGKRAETSFDKGVNSVSWLLIRFMLVMVPLIFLVNGLMKGDWFEALLFAIAVAVGLTPEMLPMIVTANLAKGAVNMSKHKVIVKRLNAIQNIGAMDILCTDKTGTLTLDNIVLERHLNVFGYEDDDVLK